MTFCFGIGGGNSLAGLGSGHGSLSPTMLFRLLLIPVPDGNWDPDAVGAWRIFSISLFEMLLRLLPIPDPMFPDGNWDPDAVGASRAFSISLLEMLFRLLL